MNDTATRPLPSRANAIAMPAIVSVLMPSGAAAGRMPQLKSPMCRSLPFIGGPSLPICAFSTIRTVAGVAAASPARRRGRGSSARRRRRCQLAVVAAPAVAAAQPDGGGVDRFLTERPESLALERHALIRDLAAREELLQAVVDGARQHHAAQDLAPFVRRSATRRSPRGRGSRRRRRRAPAAPARAARPRRRLASCPEDRARRAAASSFRERSECWQVRSRDSALLAEPPDGRAPHSKSERARTPRARTESGPGRTSRDVPRAPERPRLRIAPHRNGYRLGSWDRWELGADEPFQRLG